MSYAKDFARIYDVVESYKVFSDHEHHHLDAFFAQDLDLKRVIANSYIYWAAGGNIDEIMSNRAAFIDAVRFNSYFEWLEKGIQKLHNLDCSVNADTWDQVSEVIRIANKDKDFHWKSLLKHDYDAIILDSYWDPGYNGGHPEIFKTTFRIDKLAWGHHETAPVIECGPLVDTNPMIPWQHYGFKGKTLSDYVNMAQSLIEKLYAEDKIVSIKTAIAYYRTINFYPDDKAMAERAWGKPREEVTQEELLCFGNYIIHRCFETAEKHDIPIQIHTGLADLRGSDPMLVEPLLRQYSKARFILFHSGYPWTSQVAALAHNFPNAFPNLTWTPIINTAAAIRTLDEYIDAAPSINTITWGGDCWTAEESVGSQLAWRYVVATVLTDRFRAGRLKGRDIDVLAKKLMLTNGRHVYLEHGR